MAYCNSRSHSSRTDCDYHTDYYYEMMTTEEWNDKPKGTQAMTQDNHNDRRRKHMAVMDDRKEAALQNLSDAGQAWDAAPEKIYMDGDIEKGEGHWSRCFETPKPCSEPAIEYTRTDLSQAAIARAEQAEARESALIKGAEINRQALLKHNAAHAEQVKTLQALVAQRETEAKLAKAVKLIGLAVELARFDLNPKLCEDMTDFVTELKLEKTE